MDVKLKPCPFCGASAILWKRNGEVRIDCSKWSASDKSTHFVGIGARTEEEAIEAWNRRTDHERFD